MGFEDNFFEDSEEKEIEQYQQIIEDISNALETKDIIYFDSEELYDAADYFISINDQDKALKIINYALNIFPNNTDFQLLKAEVLINKESFKEAMHLLKEIEKKEPYNTHVYIYKANIYQIEGQSKKSIKEFQRALTLNVNDPEIIYEHMGHFYIVEEDFDLALENFLKCVELDNDNENAFRTLTDLFITEFDVMDGLALFEKFTSEHPDAIYAWYSAGRLFQVLKLYDKAIKAYEKALRIDNDFTDAIENVINCLKETEDFARIIQICKYYKDYNYPYFVYELAEAYYSMGELDLAKKNYFEIYNKIPNHTGSITGIARCFFVNYEYQKAFNFLDTCIKNIADNYELIFYKGILQKNYGLLEEAAITFSQAHNQSEFEDNSDLAFELADTYYLLEEFDKAYDVLLTNHNTNIFISPKNLFFLAACYYNRNDLDKAYNYFEDAIKMNSKLWNVFYDKCTKAESDMIILELIKKYDL